MENNKITLTNSAIKCFKSCARKYYWRYVEQITPRETPEALALGTAVHSFLENFYQGQANLPRPIESLSPRSKGILKGVSETYPRLYQDDFGLFEVVSTEQTISGDIGHPEAKYACSSYQFGGKIDMLVRLKKKMDPIPKESLVLFETKTAACVNEGFWETLSMDLQTTLYANYLEKELKESLRYVMFNVIQKPGIRQKKSETPEAFGTRVESEMTNRDLYHRKVVEISELRQRETLIDLWYTKEQIVEAGTQNVYTKTPGSCFAFHRACDYFPLCTSEDPEAILDRDDTYIRRVANVELLEESSPTLKPAFQEIPLQGEKYGK